MNRVIALILVLLPGLQSFEQTRQKVYSENNPVGVSYGYTFDYSRTFANDQYETNYRPIVYFVWYPSVESEQKAMAYHEYIDLLTDSTNFEPSFFTFANALKNYTKQSIKDNAIGWHFNQWNKEADSVYNELMQIEFKANLNANAIPNKKFPVIIYHPGLGGNIFENLQLFELLASKGYLVISAAFQYQTPWNKHFYCGQMTNSQEDIDFIISQIIPEIPQANRDKIGIMGHSFGAQAAYVYITKENNVVDAMVSLDNTFDYKSIPEIEKPYYMNTSWGDVYQALTNNYANCKAAILNISGTAEDGSMPRYHLSKRLFLSEIYLATYPFPLLHESYLSEASLCYPLVIEKYKEPKEQEELKKNREAYDTVNALVCNFFDACLKKYSKILEPNFENITIHHQTPLLIPNNETLATIYSHYGADSIKLLYKYLQSISPSAKFSITPFVDSLKNNNKISDALDILQTIYSYDNSNWPIAVTLGQLNLELNNKKSALHYLQNAAKYCDDKSSLTEIKNLIIQAK